MGLFFSFVLVSSSTCGVINGSLLKATPFQFFSIGFFPLPEARFWGQNSRLLPLDLWYTWLVPESWQMAPRFLESLRSPSLTTRAQN